MPQSFPAAPASEVPPRRRALRAARALRAPAGRKWLWLRSLAVVALMRLGLWTISLRRLQGIVSRLGRGRYSEPIPLNSEVEQSRASEVQVLEAHEAASEHEASWAIRHAARLVPGASCLTQALSLQVVLGQRGIGSRLCIGVRKGNAKGFEAHAWVERGGRVLIGGEQQARQDDHWTPLTSWDFVPEVSQQSTSTP